MATPRSSVGPGSRDSEDPWDWSVDQVVDALCHRRSLLLGPDDFPRVFPDAIELESILRNNSIGGLALLTDVNNATMREDLSIKQLGHRSSITHVIRLLRRHSPKWLANHQAATAENYLSGYGGASNTARELGASPFPRSPAAFNQGFTPYNGYGHRTAPGPNLRTQHWVQGQDTHVGEPSPSRSGYGSFHQNILHEAPALSRPDPRSMIFPATPVAEVTTGHETPSRLNLSGLDLHTENPVAHETTENTTAANELPSEGVNAVGNGAQDPRGEITIIDENGRKRRKLILGSTEQAIPKEQDQPTTAILTPPSEEPSFGEHLNHDSAANTIDGNPLIVADIELPPTTPEPSAGVENLEVDDHCEPGARTIDEKTGRKRMKPILLSQPAEDFLSIPEQSRAAIAERGSNETFVPQSTSKTVVEADDEECTRSKIERASEHTYLGVKAQAIDEIFYGATAFGQPLVNEVERGESSLGDDTIVEPDNFIILSERHVGNGHRLYAHSQIKHFLRSAQHQFLTRKGKNVCAIVPYSAKLVRKHHPLSMTEIEESSNGYIATRQNRSRLVHDSSPFVSKPKLEKTLFNFPELTARPGQVDSFEPEFLEKWKYQDDEDEVLPLFGESGSEGEYDLETWREMEDEQGTLARPLKRSTSKMMSEDDVAKAIDQAIEQIHEAWSTQRLPKLERTGWRLWMRCAKAGSKRSRISELTATIDSLETRLSSIRKEILGEAWSSSKQVIKQCKILQPSLHDKDDCQWRLSILGSKNPPSKPNTLPSRPKSIKSQVEEEPLVDGEEIIMSEDSASYTSEDDVDDFVVDDDLATDPGPDEDVMMAETEDEDSLDSSDADGIEEIGMPSPSPLSQDPKLSPVRHPKTLKLLPPQKPQTKENVNQQSVYVDLTQASDAVKLEERNPKSQSPPPNNIRTPPLMAQESSSDDTKGVTLKSTGFKRPPVAPEIIDLESDTDEEVLPLSQTGLPNIKDYEGISKLDILVLEERLDRKRLLIWVLNKYRPNQRQSVLELTRDMSMHDLRIHLWKALNTYQAHGWRMRGIDPVISNTVMLIAALFVSWTIPVRLNPKGGIRKDHIGIAIDNQEGFDPFYSFLVECLGRFELRYESSTASEGRIAGTPTPKHIQQPSQISLETQEDTPTKKPAKEVSQDYNSSIYATSQKKRKFVVQESQEAKELRSQAQQRTQDLDMRKKTSKLRYEKMGLNDEDPSKVVVNPGAEEGQPFVYLNPKIGQLIQPHQKDGVQFLWREITSDPQNLQGCLLAHTMGLGKTMQVITLLVTIAEAAKSSDVKICEQVPEPLRKSQTLIVCPASLIENWYEEFWIWAPDPVEDNVGDIRKVTSAMTLPQRVVDIKAWRDEGGVLLMGFNTFRALVGNARKRLNEETHQEILRALLEKPSIIVADEAHTAKNLKSKLNVAMNRFSSSSRIGLTGSPLANNLDEYYALIDWVAPNYLGDHIQFKAHYAEPIQQGFYKDSTPGDYIESRKRLKALITDLEPKVHRADISVLKGKLKPKTEFLIKVPLTKLQIDLYQQYVDWMLGVAHAEEPRTATLWAWLGELRLLCNHPKCYKDRLKEKIAAREAQLKNIGEEKRSTKRPRKKKRQTSESEIISSDDEVEMLDAAAQDPQVSTAMMDKQLAIMNQVSGPIGSVTQAYKMQMVDQILSLAKEANDRTLVFSHSIKTLDYVEHRLRKKNEEFSRIDGRVFTNLRQSMTKKFNAGSAMVCLISTRAGGQGLNLFGANRVIILDTSFNPIWEEQAIGRAYRMGQQKPVYVYRLTVGGTFEEALLNQSVFKQQLATRVVDKKNPMRYATRGAKQYLFKPKDLEQKNLDQFMGKDPLVLDRLLNKYKEDQIVRSIDLTETFHEEDTVELTAEELKEAQAIQAEAQLRRRDPVAYQAKILARQRQVALEYRQKYPQEYPQAPPRAFPQAFPPNFPRGQPPIHQQDAGRFIPAIFQGAPSGTLPNGNTVNNGNPSDATHHSDHVSAFKPHTPSDGAPESKLVGSILPPDHTSNFPPVLGMNTLRRNASESPEEHTAAHQMATRAESEPYPDGSSGVTQAQRPESTITESKKPKASTSVHAEPGHLETAAKVPKQPHVPNFSRINLEGPAQRPSSTANLNSASSASNLKGKYPPSSARPAEFSAVKNSSADPPNTSRTKFEGPAQRPPSTANSNSASSTTNHKRRHSQSSAPPAQTSSEQKIFAEPPKASRSSTPSTVGAKGSRDALSSRFGFSSLNGLFKKETFKNAGPKT